MKKWLQVIIVIMSLSLALNLPTGSAVRAQSTTVTIDAQAQVAEGSDFIARVNIANVVNLDATNYDVTYDANVLRADDVTSGLINGTTISVDIWRETTPGTVRVVQNIPGLSGVSGSGYLAEIHFHVVGSAGSTCNIGLTNGILSDIYANPISATWTGDSVLISTVLNADFSGSPTRGIVGSTQFAFTDASSGGTPPYTYQWDFDNNGTWDSTAQNPAYAYGAAGNYAVTLKVTDAAGNTNTKTKTGYISVYAVPQAEFTGDRTAIVVGQSVQFTNSSTGGVAPLSYQWDFDNNGTWDSTAQNPAYVYGAAGNYAVTLKITDAADNTNTKTKTGYIAVYKLGDANQDGNVNSVDITKVERQIIMLDVQTPGADANGDGRIDALDITTIEHIIMGG